MYTLCGKTITSSYHLVSHIDNVLRQQDGFEGHLTYSFYKDPDTLKVHYTMFLMLKYKIMTARYVEISLEQMVCLEEVIW